MPENGGKAVVITHWVVDVVKALAGWEGIVGVNVFKPTNSQEHSNWRTKSKKCLRMESQLWIINRYLWQDSKVTKMHAITFLTVFLLRKQILENCF